MRLIDWIEVEKQANRVLSPGLYVEDQCHACGHVWLEAIYTDTNKTPGTVDNIAYCPVCEAPPPHAIIITKIGSDQTLTRVAARVERPRGYQGSLFTEEKKP